MFTNYGKDEDEKKCITCGQEGVGVGVFFYEAYLGNETEYIAGIQYNPDGNTYYTESDLQLWVDRGSGECTWD